MTDSSRTVSSGSATPVNPPAEPAHTPQGIDWPVFIISGGVLAVFAIAALVDLDAVSALIQSAFGVSTQYFGAYWQALMLATFVIAIVLTIGRTGRVRMGGLAAPDISTLRWMAIILCTLLAGGGVFWAAAEPIAHFTSPPPVFGADAPTGNADAAYNALAQSFMHWGFLAWAMLGSLTGIIFMYLHYEKGLPLKPRTLLYPCSATASCVAPSVRWSMPAACWQWWPVP